MHPVSTNLDLHVQTQIIVTIITVIIVRSHLGSTVRDRLSRDRLRMMSAVLQIATLIGWMSRGVIYGHCTGTDLVRRGLLLTVSTIGRM